MSLFNVLVNISKKILYLAKFLLFTKDFKVFQEAAAGRNKQAMGPQV
jgi:hypothetical protein